METNLPEGFTVFRFPRSTWRRIRTNNGLENLNRQIRRRTRVVGIFPNTESALRLITAVVEEIHEGGSDEGAAAIGVLGVYDSLVMGAGFGWVFGLGVGAVVGGAVGL